MKMRTEDEQRLILYGYCSLNRLRSYGTPVDISVDKSTLKINTFTVKKCSNDQKLCSIYFFFCKGKITKVSAEF